MGIPSCQPADARYRNGTGGTYDRRQAPSLAAPRGRGRTACLWLIAFALFWGGAAWAETLRVATFNTELSRKGPGLLLRDILSGKAPDVLAAAQMIAASQADVVALQSFDFDAENRALTAFRDLIAKNGLDYPHMFAAPPNAGLYTGIDLNGDGRLGPEDRQGYGRFHGQAGMAVLSRLPLDTKGFTDLSDLIWAAQSWATLPPMSDEARARQRLSSIGHWRIPVRLADGSHIHLLTLHASPPVFDGPEDRNGLRNGDEIRLIHSHLNTLREAQFVILGDLNNDPTLGEGLKPPLHALLNDPRLADAAAPFPTADWRDLGLPPMRVSYILPQRTLTVTARGHIPPPVGASRHRLIWADLTIPP